MKFFAWLNDQQHGPFEEEAIKEMLSKKQITRDTLVCPEGGDLDEFISLMTDDNLACSIRWSAAESHFYSKSTL